MKLKAIKNVVTSKMGRQVLTAQKHSPAVLFTVGVIGVAGTVFLACRATLKLEEILNKTEQELDLVNTLEHEDYSNADKQKDRTIVYVRTVGRVAALYAPAIAVGLVSIGALSGSHLILSRRNFALTAAYAAIDKGFREYRSRVIHEFGEEKDRELRYNLQQRTIVEETAEGPVTKVVKDVLPMMPSIYARYFDKHSKNWSPTPSYNQLFLNAQRNYANDLLQSRGHIFLNEVYDMLGLPRSPQGAMVGWVKGNKGGDDYVDFGFFENVYEGQRFVNGHTDDILLDFNVDGVIYNLI